MDFRALVAIGVFVAGNAFAQDEPTWRVVVGHDPLQDRTACLMESMRVIVHDGQTTTPVHFSYNGTAFLVTTNSNIDISYPNTGLQVDTHPRIAIERVYESTNIVFAGNATRIRTQFMHGMVAKLSLGFWPTWPQGGTVVAKFSLIGFTRAHEDFLRCQRTGYLERSDKKNVGR